MRLQVLRLAVTATIFTALIGCSSSTSPGIHPEITNVPDNFQFQITNVRNYTHTFEYAWSNSGTGATVNQASAVSGGEIHVRILDSGGSEVYARSLTENGTFQASAGQSGTWTIRVELAGGSGTLNFRVQTL